MQANIAWIKREGSCFDKLPNGINVQARIDTGIFISLMTGNDSHRLFKDNVVSWRPIGRIKIPHVVQA